MSNSVGKLYEYIIEGVVREATADFEDMGVPLSVLHQLKNEWQKRLSAMHVTNYLPWDMNDRWAAGAPVYYGGYDLGMPVLGANGQNTQQQPPQPPLQPQTGSGMIKQEESYSSYSQAPQVIPQATQRQQQQQPPQQQDQSGLVLPQVPQTDGVPVVLGKQDLLKIIGEKMAEMSQADGNGEEVGSDLDDSEDDLNSDEEEGDNGMVMLCLYEKVQRVKNKWKFIFKDGVATINGSDYVFSRGTGEAEW